MVFVFGWGLSGVTFRWVEVGDGWRFKGGWAGLWVCGWAVGVWVVV